MAKFDDISLASDGWSVPPYQGVVDLGKRYREYGYAYCLDYAKALSETHLKPGSTAILAGFLEGRMYVLAEFRN